MHLDHLKDIQYGPLEEYAFGPFEGHTIGPFEGHTMGPFEEHIIGVLSFEESGRRLLNEVLFDAKPKFIVLST